MAYTAKKKADGNYEVFKDGARISTGSVGALAQYGLSATKLSSTPSTSPKVDWNNLYQTYKTKAEQQNWSWFWIGSDTNTADRRYYRKENNQWIQKGSQSEAQQYYTAPKPTPTPTPTTQIPFTSADRYNPNTGQINPGYIEPATNKYNQNTGQLNPSYVEPTTTPTPTPTPAPTPTAPTPQTQTSIYQGVSVFDYLKSVGQDPYFNSRKKLAQERGIKNYTSSAQQNTQLLGMLRNAETPTQPTATTPQTSTYQGTSIVDYLKSTGQASDYSTRSKLAQEKGISGYTGTAEQNTQLLGTLKSAGTPTDTPIATATPTPLPNVLTPDQQTEYFSTQGQSATPLSPTDWLKSKTVINKDSISKMPSVVDTPAPSTGTTPELPIPQVGNIQDAFGVSMQSKVDTARTTLENTYKTQLEDLEKQRTESQQNIDELTSLQGEGVEDVEDLMQPFREKLENAERERLYINENFEANQKLTNELETLLTEGNELIRQQKEITGLSAIRNPRIDKTISDVNARAGVIEAVMSARNGQISQAYNMIDRSINAITADKQDQLTYYSTLFNFYESQKDAEGNKLTTLTNEKKSFLNAQIGLLENDMAQAQNNADYIKELMTDPDSASFMAKAGVTLNDSPETVNQKMAQESQRQEVENFKNEKLDEGYTFVPYGNGNTTFSVGGKNLSFNAPVKEVSGTTPSSYKEWQLAGSPGTYKDWLKKDDTPSSTDLKQFINKQIATPEFQALSDEDKDFYIRSQGGDPYDFGF